MYFVYLKVIGIVFALLEIINFEKEANVSVSLHVLRI